MPVPIVARADQHADLACSADAAFAFLADIRACARLFPLLEEIRRAPSFDRPGEEAWRTTLRAQGPPPFAVRPIYVCRYRPDHASRRLEWVPVSTDEANTSVSGHCAVREAPGRTRVALHLEMETTVAAPRLARRMVQQAVQLGFSAAVSAYAKRIAAHLDGR